MASEAPALGVDGLALRRGQRLLWRGLSFALGPGEALVVTGANGAGKTSLLRVLAGLLPPTRGRVRRQGRLGWLGPAAGFKPDMPLGRELGFWARLDGQGAALASAMRELGLETLVDLPCRLLSEGQRQRAQLARLIAANAELWLLDEPTGALDAGGEALVDRLVARQRAAGGIVVAATHRPLAWPHARRLCL